MLWSRSVRPATRKCGRVARRLPEGVEGGFVTLSRDSLTDGIAVGGVQSCGHPTCPTCRERIAREERDRLTRLLTAHLEAGGGIVCLALTVSHNLSHPLAESIAALKAGRKAALTGRPWRRDRDEFGVVGYTWHAEEVYTQNGWHPHMHPLILTEAPLTDAQMEKLGESMFGRYRTAVEACGRRAVYEANHLQQIRTGEGIAAYVAKGMAMETTMGSNKQSKGRTPMQLLRDYLDTGDEKLIGLFNEFEIAMDGRRTRQWSKGLASLYDLDAVALPADEEPKGELEEVLTVETPVWYELCRRELVAFIVVLLNEGRDEQAEDIVERVRLSLMEERRAKSGRDRPPGSTGSSGGPHMLIGREIRGGPLAGV